MLSINMKYEVSIRDVFVEIQNYNGNFGDPIVELVNFEPLELLASKNISNELGGGIGLLVNFSSHIDNATYEDAIYGQAALDIKVAIDEGYCNNFPVLLAALNSAFKSECEFNLALGNVYKKYVQKNA